MRDEVIGVNQDWGGRQGNRIADSGDAEVWSKPMANGSVAVVLLNRSGGTATVSTTAAQLGLGSASSYSVRDLWAHTTATISASLPSHGAAMYGNGGSTQKWTATAAGELRTAGGKCLDVIGASTTDGTGVEVWDCNGQTNQQWAKA
jgi:alpha-galactosidase